MASTLTAADYEERKQFLEDLKKLVKSEQETILYILQSYHCDYSENSNGIFFDVTKVNKEAFTKMREYMEFCKKNRDNFLQREEEERIAAEIVAGNTA
jgi:hypothetical protein